MSEDDLPWCTPIEGKVRSDEYCAALLDGTFPDHKSLKGAVEMAVMYDESQPAVLESVKTNIKSKIATKVAGCKDGRRRLQVQPVLPPPPPPADPLVLDVTTPLPPPPPPAEPLVLDVTTPLPPPPPPVDPIFDTTSPLPPPPPPTEPLLDVNGMPPPEPIYISAVKFGDFNVEDRKLLAALLLVS